MLYPFFLTSRLFIIQLDATATFCSLFKSNKKCEIHSFHEKMKSLANNVYCLIGVSREQASYRREHFANCHRFFKSPA